MESAMYLDANLDWDEILKNLDLPGPRHDCSEENRIDAIDLATTFCATKPGKPHDEYATRLNQTYQPSQPFANTTSPTAVAVKSRTPNRAGPSSDVSKKRPSQPKPVLAEPVPTPIAGHQIESQTPDSYALTPTTGSHGLPTENHTADTANFSSPGQIFKDTTLAAFPAELNIQYSASIWEDSDCSWGEEDQGEQWSLHLQQQLIKFREQTQRLTTMTSPLRSRQRTKVHSMCHLMNLSHVTVPGEDEHVHKRVLISKAHVRDSFPGEVKIWNPRKEAYVSGYVNLASIVICGSWSAGEQEPFHVKSQLWLEAFKHAGLPSPRHVLDPVNYEMEDEYMKNKALAVLICDDITSAALLTISVYWLNFMLGDLGSQGISVERCEFLHEPPPPPPEHPPTKEPDAQNVSNQTFGDLYEQVVCESTSNDKDRPGLLSPVTPAKVGRLPSVGYYFSESSAGDSSAGSNFSFMGSTYGAGKKRRRQEKAIAGFPCQAAECFMVFDRECDRRKHEKIHSDQRAHVCLECGKGFHWPKDLRRHEERRHQGKPNGHSTEE